MLLIENTETYGWEAAIRGMAGIKVEGVGV